MINEEQRYQLIQDHLRGQLSESDQQLFEDLKHDADFASLLQEEQQLSYLLKATMVSEIENQVAQSFKKEKARRKNIRNIGIAGIVAAGLAGATFVIHYPTDELEVDSTQPSKQIVEKNLEVAPQEETTTVSTMLRIPIAAEKQTSLTETVVNQAPEEMVHLHESQPIVEQPDSQIQESEIVELVESKSTILIDQCDSVTIETDVEVENACIFEEQGSIEVYAHGGKEPYSYSFNSQWTEEARLDKLEEGNYEVMVKDAKGCLSTTLSVQVDKVRCQELPKAFILGDEWVYQSDDSIVLLKIMSRFGELVYSIEGENPIWNGTDLAGNFAKTDDYIFMVSIDGNLIDQGNVTLVRQ